MHLVAQLGQLALHIFVDVRRLLGLDELSSSGLLALVECSALDLPSLLKAVESNSLEHEHDATMRMKVISQKKRHTEQQRPGISSRPRG